MLSLEEHPDVSTLPEAAGCSALEVVVEDMSLAVQTGEGAARRGKALPTMADAIPEVGSEVVDHKLKGRLCDVDRYWLCYASCLLRCPCLIAFVYCVLAVLLLVPGIKQPSFTIAMEDFIVADSEEAVMEQSMVRAYMASSTRTLEFWTSSPPRRLATPNTTSTAYSAFAPSAFYLDITYFAKDDGNMLDEGMLLEVLRFEQKLRQLPGFRSLCEAADAKYRIGCNPGISLVNHIWATELLDEARDDSKVLYRLDGLGASALNLDVVLAVLDQRGVLQRFLPATYRLPAATESMFGVSRTSFLRSGFRFWVAHSTVSLEEFQQILMTEVAPMIRQEAASARFDVSYQGTGSIELEMWQTFFQDAFWSIGAMVFITLFMYMNSFSLLLTISSLSIILFTLPVGFVLLPSEDLRLTTVFSLFLMLGLGADLFFVFTQFWNQSKAVRESPAERMAWVMPQAVVCCLATSLTTSVSFFANMASVFKPLREFGYFVGVCVLSCFVLMSLLMPPLILARDKYCRCRYSFGKSLPWEQRCANSSEMVSRILLDLVKIESKCPCFFVLLFFGAVAGFIAGILQSAKLDLDIPAMLPDTHNVAKTEESNRRFSFLQRGWSSFDIESELFGTVCQPTDWNISSCLWQWCESESLQQGAESVTCWHSPVMPTGNEKVAVSAKDCGRVNLSMRVMSQETLSSNATGSLHKFWAGLLQEAPFDLEVDDNASLIFSSLALSMVLENWETGFSEVLAIQEGRLSTTSSGTGDCEIHALCFAGERRCGLPAWSEVGRVSLQASAEPRVLTAVQGVGTQTYLPFITLQVIWGMKPASGYALLGETNLDWSWDPTFRGNSPWTQRAVYKLCSEDAQRRFKVMGTRSRCWLVEFREWALANGRHFPSLNLVEDLHSFKHFSTAVLSDFRVAGDDDQQMWRIFFGSQIESLASDKVIEHVAEWREFIMSWNLQAPEGANQAFVISPDGQTATTEISMVQSTATTFIVSIACGFFAMLMFTCSLVLATLVSILVLGVMSGLCFFMTTLMGWALGPIEILSLIIFVGYSITYSLHVAHAYHRVTVKDLLLLKAMNWPSLAKASTEPLTNAQWRSAHTALAVYRLGAPVLNSAGTTIGASFFLLMCTYSIFPKLGAVILAETILSLVVALVILPAVLLLAGPVPRQRLCRHAEANADCPLFRRMQIEFEQLEQNEEEKLSRLISETGLLYELVYVPESVPIPDDVQTEGSFPCKIGQFDIRSVEAIRPEDIKIETRHGQDGKEEAGGRVCFNATVRNVSGDFYAKEALQSLMPLTAVTSPKFDLALDMEQHRTIHLPQGVKKFAFAAPFSISWSDSLKVAEDRGQDISFFRYGGYLYFDEPGNLVHMASLMPSAQGRVFCRVPQQIDPACVEALRRSSRLVPVTQEIFPGASHFAYVSSQDHSRDCSFPDVQAGAFVFVRCQDEIMHRAE